MFQQMTEVALRGLAYLVDRTRGQVVQSRQIGTNLGISGTYVAKAFQPLARIGWLRSVKGRAGGWVLEIEPGSKSVLEAVEALEPFGEWTRCPVGHRTCGDDVDCPFHTTWSQAVAQFRDTLQQTTVDTLPRFLPPCYDFGKMGAADRTSQPEQEGLSRMRANPWWSCS